MSTRNLILLVLALVIAGGTAFMMTRQMEEAPVEQVKPDNLVLYAKANIPMGGFVRTMEHLEWKELPKDQIDDAVHVRETKESMGPFEGAVARRSYRAGDIVTAGSLIKPGSGGFLSAVLNPGMRAVSLAVNATSGNAGFIFPGDRVDVLLSHRVESRDPATGEEHKYVFSNTPITNARVLAVDQQLDNPENKAILAKTVTIEVTPKQAEAIQIATELGKVSFALRSISDSLPPVADDATKTITLENAPQEQEGETIDGEAATVQDLIAAMQEAKPSQSYTSDYEVSPALGGSAGGSRSSVLIIRGDKTENKSFSPGEQ